MSPRDVARVRRVAALKQWRADHLGVRPPERLSRLLAFAYDQDPGALPDAARAAWRFNLLIALQDATAGAWTLSQAGPSPYNPNAAPPIAEIGAIQRAIIEAAEALVSGRQYGPKIVAHLFARLGPRNIPSPPVPRRQHVLTRMFAVDLREAAGIAVTELIGQVAPGRLRRCPYISDPPTRMRLHNDLLPGACGRDRRGRRGRPLGGHAHPRSPAPLRQARGRLRPRST